MKSEDILGIPDEDLQFAVSSWMRGKIGDRWDNEFGVITSLPLPCQYVYACRGAVDEYYNGGLTQYYYNSTGKFAALAEAGFRAMGSELLADIMAQANRIADETTVILDARSNGSLNSFIALYNEGLFDKLDNAFRVEADDFDELCIDYIKANAACFGD